MQHSRHGQLALWLLALVAMPALAQHWDHAPVPRIDPSNVRISSGSLPRATVLAYSNTAPLFFAPTTGSLGEMNTVGDDVFVANPNSCGDQPLLDRVEFGLMAWGLCPVSCDVYFLVYDNSTGAFDPSSFVGGFYLADVPTGCDGGIHMTVWEVGAAWPIWTELQIPITGSPVGIVVSVAPANSNGIPFQAVVPGVSVLAAGGGPSTGSSPDALWCDSDFNGVYQASELVTFGPSVQSNMYLRFQTHLGCPACDSPLEKQAYYIEGTGNDTMWTWSIESPAQEFDQILNPWGAGPVPVGGSALEIATAFADNINDLVASIGCGIGVAFAEAKNVSPPSASKAELDIYVRSNGSYDLFVGPGFSIPTCKVPMKPFLGCQFNPTILEVELSGQDCNNNGTDDAMDIAAGLSADTDGNVIPDECERGVHKVGSAGSNGAGSPRPR